MDIINNTRIILQALRLHPADYLALLTEPERIAFVADWHAFSQAAAGLPLEAVVDQLHQLIARYPVLESEFLGNVPAGEQKFNPAELAAQGNTAKGPAGDWLVIIRNEVINVTDKINALPLPETKSSQ
ncbi:MAG: hypothetical protein P0Y53_19000 [Candidatus Pseudobacter hemicellulosilyticus]|uniref:Uncharacterized protein n=1 Tax=Candidatus Pseudobacter hemicellulosilyticus TaxID=3121375 RepID=A0AAJ6BEH1_9BACT|nr:MAG: hypothetical protein P0Y53_19000 [Pseudobacter sp.]